MKPRLRMNPINAFKKWLLHLLMPFIEGTNKKKYPSQDQRFRNLFKKRKSTIILIFFIFFLIAFGIGKSFSFITWLIAFSPFVVIFWGSFGEQLMGIFKFRKK